MEQGRQSKLSRSIRNFQFIRSAPSLGVAAPECYGLLIAGHASKMYKMIISRLFQ